MKQSILSFIMALSLLVAPVAHATEVGFQDTHSQMSDQITEHSDSEEQDSGNMAKAEHHCCCTQISAHLPIELTVHQSVADQAVFLFKDEVVRSVVIGPPLKPPSHA